MDGAAGSWLRLKCFQHPAVSRAPPGAIADHPLKFALQRLQGADPARDVGDMRLDHVVHRAAFVLALLFLKSAVGVISEAWPAWRTAAKA